MALVAVLGVLASACGPDLELGTDSAAITSGGLDANRVRDQGAMYICDVPTPPGPVDIPGLIVELEMDRVYKSARPGFIREWVPVGVLDGALFGQLVARFDTVAHAKEFGDWLSNDFIIDGTRFWDRPDFTAGHDCHTWEVLGSEDSPSTYDTQVTVRMERFAVTGHNPRAQLRAWYEQLKVESRRLGDTSVFLLYSEERQTASIIYFEGVPQADRNLMAMPPVAARPPFVQGDSFDFPAWDFAIWFPFESGDHGRPALWPLPGLEAWEGDGMCSLSRHETYRTTSDCLPTCGNGVRDPGETPHNCPADVPL